MEEIERLKRARAALDHYIAYGVRIDKDDDRLRVFLNDTACIPFELFEVACTVSRQQHEGNFAPTSGQVIRTAVLVEQRREPARFQNQSGGICKPRWYNLMRSGRVPIQLAAVASEKTA